MKQNNVPLQSAIDAVGDCCGVVNLCKSEMIDYIERNHPVSKMNLHEDKKSSSDG